MGLLSGISDFVSGAVKKVAKVLDNPVSRTIAKASGMGGQAATLSAIAGNKAGTAALLGSTGAAWDTNTFATPGIISGGSSMGLLKTLPVGLPTFVPTAMPGSGMTTQQGQSVAAAAGLGSGAVQAMGNFPGAPVYKVLRNGKVRVGRLGADGRAHFTRRMNPMNPRAARRAIKRIMAVRRITRDIERSLPRARARR